jgi:23S rRNA (adenine2503-C2)-methyltransferase
MDIQTDTSNSAASLVDCDLAGLEAEISAAGHKPVHAGRVLRHFYESCGTLNANAIPISKGVARFIQQRYPSRRSRVISQAISSDGTTKLLIGLTGGGSVESVLMPGLRPGMAAGCVSSQIGCAMGCDFCASTRFGLERNLQAGEIVEQFLHLKELSAKIGRRLKTIVFMGMGEPLLNFDAVVAAIRTIADPRLGGLGWRQITVSTVGIVPGIDRLAEANLNVHLAVSLHAPDDETRSRLVPMNRKYPVAGVMAAARRFADRTGRVPNIEYCMLAGVNDSDEQAELLADLMQNFRAHVNLIPFNPIGAGISGYCYTRPSSQRMEQFMRILRGRGVVAHFRRSRGEDVNAACGQLRQANLPI